MPAFRFDSRRCRRRHGLPQVPRSLSRVQRQSIRRRRNASLRPAAAFVFSAELTHIHRMPDQPPPPLDPAALQARLTGILEAAIDAIVTVDHAGRFPRFRSRRRAHLRLHPRHRARSRHDEPDRPRPAPRPPGRQLALYAGAAQDARPPDRDRRLRADGTEFPVGSPSPASPARARPFTAHLRDITERKATEARLLAPPTPSSRNASPSAPPTSPARTPPSRPPPPASASRKPRSNAASTPTPPVMAISRVGDGRLIEVNPSFRRICGSHPRPSQSATPPSASACGPAPPSAMSSSKNSSPTNRSATPRRISAAPTVTRSPSCSTPTGLEIGGEACSAPPSVSTSPSAAAATASKPPPTPSPRPPSPAVISRRCSPNSTASSAASSTPRISSSPSSTPTAPSSRSPTSSTRPPRRPRPASPASASPNTSSTPATPPLHRRRAHRHPPR